MSGHSVLAGCPSHMSDDRFENDHTNPSEKPTNKDHEGGLEPQQLGLDANVRRLLGVLGLTQCRAETSVVIAEYARVVSREFFEATLVHLADLRPIWTELVKRRRMRVMDTLLDEFIWFTKNQRCQHAAPAEIARHMRLITVFDLGAELAKRL